ncbi:MAG: NAD-dependent epimerase/dehydratase family protein [Vibrionaceae bacterium]|nr:NAD-dependent epimerase/dehydratase family protein [Vibrionaceae bacterium]
MKVFVSGGAGFIATKLIQELNAQETLSVSGSVFPISEIHAADIFAPVVPIDGVTYYQASLDNQHAVNELISAIQPDVVIHLAAVVSSAAEADFDLGLQVNIDGTRFLLEACRNLPKPPKFVFASSVAVFSNVAHIEDSTIPEPTSTYGMNKVVGEYLVNDYSRKGFIDGISVRLPTIAIRPGKPNKAASSFVSSIIREPLNQQEAICPVDKDLKLWISSPSTVVKNIVHALSLAKDSLNGFSTVNLPGISVSVQEMVASLEDNGGDSSYIRWEQDDSIKKIVNEWPAGMNTVKANQLGFYVNSDIQEIVREYIESLAQ